MVGCVENGREDVSGNLEDRFVRWCGENQLQLNVMKIKEIVEEQAPIFSRLY